MIRRAFSRFEKREAGSTRKEKTEASPPNEEASKTADEEGSKTADEERSNIADEEESKAAHGASLTAADDAKNIRQKKSLHAETWRL